MARGKRDGQAPTSLERHLGIKEAAERIGVPDSTLKTWVRLGRIPRVKSGPTVARTAAITSRVSLMRFSRLPPYSSVRRFVNGDRNCLSRELWPICSSMPSKPPSRV